MMSDKAPPEGIAGGPISSARLAGKAHDEKHHHHHSDKDPLIIKDEDRNMLRRKSSGIDKIEGIAGGPISSARVSAPSKAGPCMD